MGALATGATAGVDGTVAKLQPLTVTQEPHHVEEAQGEDANVGVSEAHRRT